jgi:hypothetical protein
MPIKLIIATLAVLLSLAVPATADAWAHKHYVEKFVPAHSFRTFEIRHPDRKVRWIRLDWFTDRSGTVNGACFNTTKGWECHDGKTAVACRRVTYHVIGCTLANSYSAGRTTLTVLADGG